MKFAVSACLLGQKVRYDGGHKLFAFLDDGWGGLIQFMPLCPEVQAGLPTPREPIELFAQGSARPTSTPLRAVGLKTGDDYTARLTEWAEARLSALDEPGLLGLILKSGSPSCGTRIRVNAHKTNTTEKSGEGFVGSGLFVQAVRKLLPLLPVTDELTLLNRAGRARFLAQAFILRRWRETKGLAGQGSPLSEFHRLLTPFFSSPDTDLLRQMTAFAHETFATSSASTYEALLLELLGGAFKGEAALEGLKVLLDAGELALVEASANYGES